MRAQSPTIEEIKLEDTRSARGGESSPSEDEEDEEDDEEEVYACDAIKYAIYYNKAKAPEDANGKRVPGWRYGVLWQGYPDPSDDTEEPYDNFGSLENSMPVLFWQALGIPINRQDREPFGKPGDMYETPPTLLKTWLKDAKRDYKTYKRHWTAEVRKSSYRLLKVPNSEGGEEADRPKSKGVGSSKGGRDVSPVRQATQSSVDGDTKKQISANAVASGSRVMRASVSSADEPLAGSKPNSKPKPFRVQSPTPDRQLLSTRTTTGNPTKITWKLTGKGKSTPRQLRALSDEIDELEESEDDRSKPPPKRLRAAATTKKGSSASNDGDKDITRSPTLSDSAPQATALKKRKRIEEVAVAKQAKQAKVQDRAARRVARPVPELEGSDDGEFEDVDVALGAPSSRTLKAGLDKPPPPRKRPEAVPMKPSETPLRKRRSTESNGHDESDAESPAFVIRSDSASKYANLPKFGRKPSVPTPPASEPDEATEAAKSHPRRPFVGPPRIRDFAPEPLRLTRKSLINSQRQGKEPLFLDGPDANPSPLRISRMPRTAQIFLPASTASASLSTTISAPSEPVNGQPNFDVRLGVLSERPSATAEAEEPLIRTPSISPPPVAHRRMVKALPTTAIAPPLVPLVRTPSGSPPMLPPDTPPPLNSPTYRIEPGYAAAVPSATSSTQSLWNLSAKPSSPTPGGIILTDSRRALNRASANGQHTTDQPSNAPVPSRIPPNWAAHDDRARLDRPNNPAAGTNTRPFVKSNIVSTAKAPIDVDRWGQKYKQSRQIKALDLEAEAALALLNHRIADVISAVEAAALPAPSFADGVVPPGQASVPLHEASQKNAARSNRGRGRGRSQERGRGQGRGRGRGRGQTRAQTERPVQTQLPAIHSATHAPNAHPYAAGQPPFGSPLASYQSPPSLPSASVPPQSFGRPGFYMPDVPRTAYPLGVGGRDQYSAPIPLQAHPLAVGATTGQHTMSRVSFSLNPGGPSQQAAPPHQKHVVTAASSIGHHAYPGHYPHLSDLRPTPALGPAQPNTSLPIWHRPPEQDPALVWTGPPPQGAPEHGAPGYTYYNTPQPWRQLQLPPAGPPGQDPRRFPRNGSAFRPPS